MKIQAKKKIDLALQGGGTHGALAWGVLDKLLEDGRIEIDSISATSSGAVIGVVLANGLIKGGPEGARQALSDFWHDISNHAAALNPFMHNFWEDYFNIPYEARTSYYMFNLATHLLSPSQFNPMKYNPLRDLLEKHVDFKKFKESNPIKLFICATNVKTSKIKIFDNHEMTIDSVLASACLPELFQAVEIDGESYWDGGFMGNPAIYPLIYHSKTQDILIIHINPIIRYDVPESKEDIENRINEISFNSSLMREMRAIHFVTQLIDNKKIKDEYLKDFKKVYLHSIRTDELMEPFSIASKMNADWSFINTLFEIGRKSAEHWLLENFESIGVRSTIDFNEFL